MDEQQVPQVLGTPLPEIARSSSTGTSDYGLLRRVNTHGTVGTINGIANPGAGTLVVEVHALIPETVAEPISS